MKFFPTDVSYFVKDGKAIIRLFGSSDGRRVCVLDDFEPYFFVEDIAPSSIESLSDGEARVVSVVRVKKKVNEVERDLLKVIVNLPSSVPILRDKIKKLGVDVFEADILFSRRYVIDKGVVPFVECVVDCVEVASEFKVPTFRASKIVPGSSVIKPKILAVDIETYNPTNTLNHNNPIIMVSVYGDNFSRVVTWKKFKADSFVEFVSSEADMIQRFVELVSDYAPDIIVGYFTDGFDFPYLVARAKKLKVKLALGLDGSEVDISGKTQSEARITGIAHIDVMKFIRRVIAPTMETDVYTLDAVSAELLGEGKHPVDMNKLFSVWDSGSDELSEYAFYNLKDSELTYRLAVLVFPNLVELVRIIQLPAFDVSRMSFSQFVEWFLVKESHHRDEIILNRPSRSAESARMSDRIKGAFVYEPKPGLYDNIVVFDYRSLYPSIIASHNVSKGTLGCSCCKSGKFSIKTDRGLLWYCERKEGLFSSVIRDLIVRRAELKKELKKSKDPLLVARSNALKLLANSFYGYMGFAPARWYCIECAESTTAWARHYITQAIESAEAGGFKVLYSDTDSVFLLLGDRSVDDAVKLVDGINEKLPGLMELEYEDFYPAGIFVALKGSGEGAKKKYALVDKSGVLKIRGFETVRRNVSFIARSVQRRVLEILLREKDVDKAKNFVRDVVFDLRDNKVPVDKVVIRTKLTKDIESYSSVGPHVAAAQRIKDSGGIVGGGTIVGYVIVKGKGKIRDKVKLPGEISQSDYDGEYYIENQILPAVTQIFSVFHIGVDDLSSKSKQKSLGDF